MTGRSEDAVAVALSAVLRDHGWTAALNAKRLRASLNDVLGVESDSHRGELDAIVLAVEEGIVAELRDAVGPDREAGLPTMVDRLAEWGPSRDRAAWAVQTWVDRLPEPTLRPPTTAEPPSTREPALASTTLPPASTGSSPGAAAARPMDPTQAPPQPADHPRDRPADRPADDPADPPSRRLRGRKVLLTAAALVAVLVAGGVTAALSWPDDTTPTSSPREPAAGASDSTPTPTPSPVESGTVAAIASARVPAAEKHAAMASRTGGVRVPRLGEVETVTLGDEERSAPEGGRLIAFRLTDWPCEGGSCRPWPRLGLRVVVGGEDRPLPKPRGGDTFVVAVPSGVSDVDLVMKADGLPQRISLVEGTPDNRNVAVLARRGRVDRIGERLTLVERTSQAFDYGDRVTDTVPRQVSVTKAELRFFTKHGRPSSPGQAFLKVRAEYTIPFSSFAGESYAFELREIGFVARDGTRYEARDIDEGPGIDAVFEVPANLQGGTFQMGGGPYEVSTDGLTFTRTVEKRSIKIRFG